MPPSLSAYKCPHHMQAAQHACRRFSRHLHVTVLARARRSLRVGRALPDASQKHRPDAAIIKIQQALKYEEGHHYVNTQGTHSDFANALIGYLANLRGVLPLQTAQALEPFQEKAKRYPDWNPDERREFLQPLPRVLDGLIRASSGEVRRRAVPVPMSVRGTYSSSSPTRHDLYFYNSKLKTGHQAPVDGPQTKPASSANTATAADALSASHSDNTAGLRPANAASSHRPVAQPSQLLSRTEVDDGMQQVYSNVEPVLTSTQDSGHSSSSSNNGNVFDPNLPSGSAQAASVHAIFEPSLAAQSGVRSVTQPHRLRDRQPSAAVDESYDLRTAQHGDTTREVMLSDEVKDFLAQPVSGPCRPIIFDLETTGRCMPSERIIELAVIGGHSGEVYSSLVNSEGVPSSPSAFQAHGITNQESWHPSTPSFGRVMGQMLEFVRQECSGPEGGIPVLIAHNGKIFDYKFLDQECKRWNFQLPRDWQWMDSLLLARDCVKSTPEEKAYRGLQALRERFGIAPNQAHRALADCEILLSILPRLLELNGTPDLAELMRRGSKCSGTLGNVLGPAPRQKALEAAKLKSTELTTDLLVHDEEEACFSEPDPVSVSGLAEPLASKVNLEKLKKVKVNWRHGVVDNEQLNRELLDTPPDKLKKALTPGQQTKVKKAGFETFWEVLQYYPKEYIPFQPHLQHEKHVVVRGTVTKSYGGSHGFNMEVLVDPVCSPLLHPPADDPSPDSPDDPHQDLGRSFQQEEEDQASCTDADDEDQADLSSDSDLHSVSGLDKHGRSVIPEEASTSVLSHSSSSSLDASRASSSPGAHPGILSFPSQTVANPQTNSERQTLAVNKFFQGSKGAFGARNLANQYRVGSEVMVQGKVTMGTKPGTWVTPDAVLAHATAPSSSPAPQLVGRYPARTPIKDKEWPAIIEKALRAVQDSKALQGYDVVPSMLTDQYDLIGWLQALRAIHQPRDWADVEAAKRRLAFEELLLLQLKLLLRREINRTPRSEVDLEGTRVTQLDMMEAGRDVLGFGLTAAQDRVLTEILRDMQGPAPMMRLLQGDVGSGKTAVAFLALLAAAGSGWQGALMAPTEVLAEQHMMKLEQLVRAMPLHHRPRVAILTGSAKTKERRAVYASLADGSTGIVVGTHALITDALEFKKLGLAVIDEQHRFGVNQRAKLQNKNTPLPHVLSMTATPIPRTLALTAHGDMALSAIDELPPGRHPVLTYAQQDTPAVRNKMYSTIRKELEAGGRAYIICPLVDESSSEIMAGIKAAEEEHRRLQQTGVLGDAKCGLLHGRMSSEDKFAALQAFASGETPVLISTTVVEVGVDVPEASVIIVEHSERFGLAQLHQLRGRVGRGKRASTCYLMTPHRTALTRLQVLTRSQNGFTIAEADLQER
ncbi:TPA: hypothetical protein ACH3X1_000615 [Trebouxia sp. C0004]